MKSVSLEETILRATRVSEPSRHFRSSHAPLKTDGRPGVAAVESSKIELARHSPEDD